MEESTVRSQRRRSNMVQDTDQPINKSKVSENQKYAWYGTGFFVECTWILTFDTCGAKASVSEGTIDFWDKFLP